MARTGTTEEVHRRAGDAAPLGVKKRWYESQQVFEQRARSAPDPEAIARERRHRSLCREVLLRNKGAEGARCLRCGARVEVTVGFEFVPGRSLSSGTIMREVSEGDRAVLRFKCRTCTREWQLSDGTQVPEPTREVLAQALQREILEQQLAELRQLRLTTEEELRRRRSLDAAIALTLMFPPK
jgi:hypothetical protein